MPERACKESIVRHKPKRRSSEIRRIVIHTAEGILDADDFPAFFRRSGDDSTLAIDATGTCVRMCPDNEKPYTQAAYNPGSLSIELCAFAAWSTHQWVAGFHKGLYRSAQACSHWALKYDQLHLRRSVSGGVCSHKALGALGGGHTDPGPNFPWRYFLTLARMHYYRHKGWHRKGRRRLRYLRYRAYVYAVERRHGVRKRKR